jgi:hypothetical protein
MFNRNMYVYDVCPANSQLNRKERHMKKSCIIIALVCLCTLAQIGVPAQAEAGPLVNVVMYIPNRVFDLMDIFRVRLRVGPGISAGVRITRPVSGYLGMHTTVYAGLPGPRGRRKIPWPVGGDVGVGAQASFIDLSERTTYYDPLELGGEAQILLLGANVGIGVYEIFDFIAGFAFIDLVGDDIGRGSKDDKAGGAAIEENEAATPEAAAPETVEPEVVEPEAVEPKAVEPEAVEPEA